MHPFVRAINNGNSISQVSGSRVNRKADIPGASLPLSVHQQHRTDIRDNIVEAVALAPNTIQIQLAVCVSQIVKNEFPER